MKYRMLIICIVINLVISISGCSASNENVLPSNKYVVVYEEIRDNGTIVSGFNPYPGMAQPPIPFLYSMSDYPPGSFPYQMNDSLKILLGVYNIKESGVSPYKQP